MFMRICCVALPFIPDARLHTLVYLGVAAEITQEKGQPSDCSSFISFFAFQIPPLVLAFFFLIARVQRSLSLMNREVDLCVPTTYYSRTPAGHDVRKCLKWCAFTRFELACQPSEGFEVAK